MPLMDVYCCTFILEWPFQFVLILKIQRQVLLSIQTLFQIRNKQNSKGVSVKHILENSTTSEGGSPEPSSSI